MEKLFGMKINDLKKLGNMLAVKAPEKTFETVAEYIANHDVKTEQRTSKKGTELIKVFYPTGKIAEYELKNIDRTTAFEI